MSGEICAKLEPLEALLEKHSNVEVMLKNSKMATTGM